MRNFARMMHLVEFKNHKKELLRGLVSRGRSRGGVLFLHGFEGSSIQPHFKNIADALRTHASTFRFDYSGCGLSDGSFEDATVDKMTAECASAMRVFDQHVPSLKSINIVAHSLSGAVALKILRMYPKAVRRVALLAPALNQKALLRYWFVRAAHKDIMRITWGNFREYLDEEGFVRSLLQKKIMRASHWMSNAYMIENASKDYQDLLHDLRARIRDVLLVGGDSDEAVPFESNDNLPKQLRAIRVEEGDHGLWRPDMVRQYLPAVVKFLRV